MEYVAQLPTGTRKMLAPMVALVIGAAGAVGAYAALDDADVGVQPTRVIVTEAPAPPSEGVAAKDEAGTAAAITGSIPSSPSFGKDEAKTAAAVGNSSAAVGNSSPLRSRFGKDEAKTAAAVGNANRAATPNTANRAATPQGIPSPAAAAAAERARELQEQEIGTAPLGQMSGHRP
jgi:hypothetical protein